MQWYYISLHYATYALHVENNIVIEAAPIARWMIGKQWTDCKKWLQNKVAIIKEI